MRKLLFKFNSHKRDDKSGSYTLNIQPNVTKENISKILSHHPKTIATGAQWAR